MKLQSGSSPPVERETRPGVGLASTVDAVIQDQVRDLATELEQRAKATQNVSLPDVDGPCTAIKEQLDEKRQDLQTQLNLTDELKSRLQVLSQIPPPDPHELRVRVLLMKGSIYDFTRLGKADHREKLDQALEHAAALLEQEWNITVVFGQPKVVEKSDASWELTPETLKQFGERYASEGTPALLFADRILLPSKKLTHSWASPEHSVAGIAEEEWLSQKPGILTAHNLARLLGLDDSPSSQHTIAQEETARQLSPEEIQELQQRTAERAARWAEENAAARQRGEEALDLSQHSVILLEQQGDQLWQLYQSCMEKKKDTPAYGVQGTGQSNTSLALTDLAYQVEHLSQRVARAEKELAAAKEMLFEIQSRLRAQSAEEHHL